MRKIRLCITIIFFSVMILVACKKEANGDDSNINTDLLKWLKDTTDIQIYLPKEWEPIKQNKSDQNYYIEATGDKEVYNIDVYRTKKPVKFNDKEALLEKNGPISESDFIGSISGGTEKNVKDYFDIPEDSKRFELIKGITAYEKDDGLSVWWNQNNWEIAYIGSANQSILQDFATALSNSNITVADTGKILIIEGNSLTFYYNWEKDEQKYSFVTHDKDIKNIKTVLNSFIKIE